MFKPCQNTLKLEKDSSENIIKSKMDEAIIHPFVDQIYNLKQVNRVRR